MPAQESFIHLARQGQFDKELKNKLAVIKQSTYSFVTAIWLEPCDLAFYQLQCQNGQGDLQGASSRVMK